MLLINKYYFFRCYHCGEWFYSNKVIKIKKCWKCNRSFQFQKSTKFSRQCTLKEAIALLKKLKEKIRNENFTNNNYFLSFR
ncbi:MAG: hypothetical protein ACTSPD_02840 [Promethearchaeota archaeon]